VQCGLPTRGPGMGVSMKSKGVLTMALIAISPGAAAAQSAVVVMEDPESGTRVECPRPPTERHDVPFTNQRTGDTFVLKGVLPYPTGKPVTTTELSSLAQLYNSLNQMSLSPVDICRKHYEIFGYRFKSASQAGLWESNMRAGAQARQQGRYAEAESLFQAALKEAEQSGPEGPRVALSLDNLAMLYYTQGRYAQAEPLYQRALAVAEKGLGPEDPYVATNLNNLGVLYRQQGKYAQAEPLHQRALAIREKRLGPEHPEVATTLDNLAELYGVQRKYA
jgi:tetratricopeptide (TPR) repeat protein